MQPIELPGTDDLRLLNKQTRESLLNTIVNNMVEAVYVVDINGHLLLTNVAGREMAGGFVHNFASDLRQIRNVYFPDTTTLFPYEQLPIVAALNGHSSTDVELYYCPQSSLSGCWYSVSARPLTDEKGVVTGAVVVARDITTRRRLQEQLQTVADEAIRSSQLKSEFIANVSHEIRTPLAGILGMSELLSTRDESDAESREISGFILQSAQTLLEVVNDLLDFSKLEAGKLTIHKQWFSVQAALEEVTNSISVAAHKKRLQVTVELDQRIPQELFGDKGRTVQVLLNFANNAVKFTERGKITLVAALQDDSPDHVRVRFSVVDTGIGIKPGVQASLFQPFVQADGSTTRRYGGTGLGLSIAKKLTLLMSGEIGLESDYGKGSHFWVSLPFDFRHNTDG